MHSSSDLKNGSNAIHRTLSNSKMSIREEAASNVLEMNQDEEILEWLSGACKVFKEQIAIECNDKHNDASWYHIQ